MPRPPRAVADGHPSDERFVDREQLRRPARPRESWLLAPGPWAGAGQAALPAAGLVEGDGHAAGADTQVRDVVKAQGGAIRASAVNGKGRMIHPVLLIVTHPEPGGEIPHVRWLRRVVGD